MKAFNHIGCADLTTANTPSGTPGRRALAIFGDDEEARATVADLVDEFGFDMVDGGPLSESWRIQRDKPGYVKPVDAEARAPRWPRRSATSAADPLPTVPRRAYPLATRDAVTVSARRRGRPA